MTDLNIPTVIRPLSAADVPAAQEVAYNSLRDAGRIFGWEMPEQDDATRHRGIRRINHALAHDPAGAFVAERDGAVIGLGLATRREQLWFLSLLTVATDAQSQGIGRRLLESTLTTLDDAGAICASADFKALRRYRRAGFDLMPGYHASGTLDRSLIPVLDGVRQGSYDDDREFIDKIAILQRGAAHGPDLDYFAGLAWPLFIVDGFVGQGYVVCREDGVEVLGATTPAAAALLLWAALAEATKPIELSWLSQHQQWALDVALDARLRLRPGGSVCVKGNVGPMSPYIPSGAWG